MKCLYLGHFSENSSWTEAATGYVLAMNSVGIDVVPRTIKLSSSNSDIPNSIKELYRKDSSGCDICIQHLLPYHLEYGNFRKNIAFFVYETSNFISSNWAQKLNMVDEVWVADQSTKNACENSGVVRPIKVIPHAIDVKKYDRDYPKIDFGMNNGNFKFYFIGDFSRRKNLAALVKAFNITFRSNEQVSLILKVSKFGLNQEQVRHEVENFCSEIKRGLKLYKNLEDYPKETIITERLTEEQLCGLHQSCQSFVLSSYGEGFCTIPGTLIDTEKGQIKIEELNIGEKVYSHTGNLRRITNILNRNYEGNIVNIKVLGLNKTFSFTEGHRHFACFRKNETILHDKKIKASFIPCEQLKKGDLWAIPKIKNQYNNYDSIKISDFIDVKLDVDGYIICNNSFDSNPKKSRTDIAKIFNTDYRYVSKILNNPEKFNSELATNIKKYVKDNDIKTPELKKIPNEIFLTPELMFFFGHYLAEGHISREHAIHLSCHSKERFGRRKSHTAILETLNLRMKHKLMKGKRCTKSYFSNAVFARLIKKICGVGAKKKFIHAILKGSKNVNYLLQGYFYGDGSYNSKGMYSFASVSDKLTDDIVEILNINGILAYPKQNFRKGQSEHINDVIISNQHSNKFNRFINAVKYNSFIKTQDKKIISKFIEDENYFYVTIRDVEIEKFSGIVYNISVDIDESYTVSRLATHNCLPVADALGFGKVPIVSDSTSLKSLVNDYNGYKISCRPEPVFGMNESFPDLYCGNSNWDSIDVLELGEMMRVVFENKAIYKKLSSNGRPSVEKYSYQDIGSLIKENLI